MLSSCSGTAENDGEILIENKENIVNISAYNVDSINPLKTQSKSAAQVLSLIYQPLFYHDENLAPKPALASGVQVSADSLHVTVNLSGGVLWQDGSSFCAADVVYSINEIKENASLYKNNVSYIASAKAVANDKVSLALFEPVMNIEGLLSFPIIKNGSAAAIEKGSNGTGAFKISEKTEQKITLLPNENYSPAPVSVSCVNVRVMRNQAACENAFEANELDAITSNEIDLGQKTPGGNIVIKNFVSNRFTFLGFNNALEKYASVNIRQAIAASADKKKIIETALYGRATSCEIPVNPSAWFYKELDGPQFDTEGAMAEIGYRKIDGKFKDESGNTAEISILVSQENSSKLAACEALAAALDYAGFDVKVEAVPFDEYITRISEGRFDAFFGEITMPDNLSPSSLTKSGNFFACEKPELDAALQLMERSTNSESLSAALEEYERVFISDPPFVPLYFASDGVVYTKQLSGISEPNFYDSFRSLEMWYFKAGIE